MAYFSQLQKHFSPVIFFKPLVPASKSSKRNSEDEQDFWDIFKALHLLSFTSTLADPKQ